VSPAMLAPRGRPSKQAAAP